MLPESSSWGGSALSFFAQDVFVQPPPSCLTLPTPKSASQVTPPSLKNWQIVGNFGFTPYSSSFQSRLEICHDRRDQWSCKIFSSCVNFSENNAFLCKFCVEIRNLLIYLLSLHKLFSKTFQIWHLHFHFNKKRTKIIYIEICAVLLLAKLIAIYVVLVCKMFCPKIWLCNFFFDKFHICFSQLTLWYRIWTRVQLIPSFPGPPFKTYFLKMGEKKGCGIFRGRSKV